MMGLEHHRMFETPLIISALEGDGAWVRPFCDLLLGKADAPEVGEAWQSDPVAKDGFGPGPEALTDAVAALASHQSVDIGTTGAPRFRWEPALQANVVRPGERIMPHYRPEAWWTAIFYCDDGFASWPDRALGGEMELEDPRMPLVLMEAPFLRFAPPGRPLEEPMVRLRPASGRLLMIPGWLRRGTRPHHGPVPQVLLTIALQVVPLD